ncbi:MAG: Sua5/YciO/YrdC/YwlC family protein [Pseudomonadales bacterium]
MSHAGGFQLQLAAHHVRCGGVVAHATQGVWGLACDPFNQHAVARLVALKERPMAKGLILIADSLERFGNLLDELDATQRGILADAWPGAVTFLIPAPRALAWLRGEHLQLAVRVPAHPQARMLCRRVGGPLVSTSANRHGCAPARSAGQVRRYFGRRLDYILPGQTSGLAGPSEIRDLTSGKVVRQASVTGH